MSYAEDMGIDIGLTDKQEEEYVKYEEKKKMEEKPQKYRGTYVGLAELPKSGVSGTGKEWTKNKLSFSHAEGKMCKFNTFLDVSLLVPGTDYFLMFNTSEFKLKDGTMAKSKTAFIIEPHSSDEPLGFVREENTQTPTQTTQPQTVQQQGVPAQTVQQQVNNNQIPSLQFDIEGFANAYRDNEAKPISDKTLHDFIGCYIENAEGDKFKTLKTLYDEIIMPNTDKAQTTLTV